MNERKIKAALGMAIREVRQASGLSQEALADLAAIHRTYVGDVERGERNVSLINMMRLAVALKVPLSQPIKRMEALCR